MNQAEWTNKKKRPISVNNIPNNRTRKTTIIWGSSTRIAPATMHSSSIPARNSTKSKNPLRRITSKANPVQHCHGTRCVLQQVPSGSGWAASSVHAIPIAACVVRSERIITRQN